MCAVRALGSIRYFQELLKMEFSAPHDPSLRVLSLSIPAHRRHLPLLGAAVEAAAREAGASADAAYAINMAVVQAISAVLRYAGTPALAQFELECLDSPDRIQVCIHDQGPLWVGTQALPGQADTLQAFELVRAMVDALEYLPHPSGNRLKLTRFRTRPVLDDED